jgi:hypothetical protein
VSLDPPTTLPKNDLLGGSLPPPDFASPAFVLSFDLGGDRAKGGERGFVFPIGSFTFRRPGLRAVACHLGLDHPLYSFLPLRIPGLIFKVRRHLRQNEFVTGLFHGGGERGPTRPSRALLSLSSAGRPQPSDNTNVPAPD